MVSISCRALLLLILVVCNTFTRVAVGDVDARDAEVIVLKRIRGSPNLRVSGGGHGLLGVADQEVGPSRRRVEGASDRLESNNKHPDRREERTLKAAMTGTVENGTGVAPADRENAAPPVKTLPSPVSAPSEFKDRTANSTNLPPPANTTANSQSPSASAGDEVKAPPVTHGGACDHGPVIGKLAATGGEDGHHDYTLIAENVGKSKLDVTIKTSSGWKATPGELALSSGQGKSVTVSVIDNKAATKHEAKITVSWSDGDCYVDVPPQNVAGDDDVDRAASYLDFFNEPGAAALLLGGSLVFLLVLGVAGVWGCISWRAHAQRHGDAETKYQELELPTTAMDAKQGDGDASPSAEGWDEVWEDDDWHDTEAVRASSAALTLSSGGLNARRANKDGWDSSWDD